MKKMIAVGIITVLALGLTGCSWFQPSEPTVEQTIVTEEQDTTPTDVTEPTEMEEPVAYECPTPEKPLTCTGLDISNEPPHPDPRCYGEGQEWVLANCSDAVILE